MFSKRNTSRSRNTCVLVSSETPLIECVLLSKTLLFLHVHKIHHISWNLNSLQRPWVYSSRCPPTFYSYSFNYWGCTFLQRAKIMYVRNGKIKMQGEICGWNRLSLINKGAGEWTEHRGKVITSKFSQISKIVLFHYFDYLKTYYNITITWASTITTAIPNSSTVKNK